MQKLIPDRRIYELAHVSVESGRRRLHELELAGRIRPLRTPTRRILLSVDEAHVLATSL